MNVQILAPAGIGLALFIAACSGGGPDLRTCGQIVDPRIREDCIDEVLEDPSVDDCTIIYGLRGLPIFNTLAAAECLHRAGVEVCQTRSSFSPDYYYDQCGTDETPNVPGIDE